MSPLSNQQPKDWPLGHFRQLAILCVERMDVVVDFVGARSQRHSVNRLVRTLPADRYRNHCGLLTWEQTGDLIRSAACVVSNDSGVGHYAADLGVPLVSVYSAVHNPYEWMPRGPNVSVLARRTLCSSCGVTGSSADCPHDLRCLSDITPSRAFDEVRLLVESPHGDIAVTPTRVAATSMR